MKRLAVGQLWNATHEEHPDLTYMFLIIAKFDIVSKGGIIGGRFIAVKPGLSVSRDYTHVFDEDGDEVCDFGAMFTLTRKSRSRGKWRDGEWRAADDHTGTRNMHFRLKKETP